MFLTTGGPGSRKAKLIEKLVDCYGLTLINTENILYDHLFQDLPENERTSVSFTPKDVAKVTMKSFPSFSYFGLEIKLDDTYKLCSAKIMRNYIYKLLFLQFNANDSTIVFLVL